MSDTDAAQAVTPASGPGAKGMLDAENALRVVLLLLALWTLLSGLALTFFRDASDATIGGGLEGGQGAAAQRLLGIHLMVLAPLYALLAWEPHRFRLLLWVPYATQAGVVISMLYDIGSGDRSVEDALLPLVVSMVFLALLLYVTFASRAAKDEDDVPAVVEGQVLPPGEPKPEELPEQPAPQ